MKTKCIPLILLTILPLWGQFGQNIVQYDEFDWQYIQTKHYDIYYNSVGRPHAEYVAVEAERAYDNISTRIGWQLSSRVTIIVYNSHNDFQQTNVIDSYMYEGIGGVTELYKNRVVIPYDGSHQEFRHVIHHELVHAFVNDYMYGGSLQNLIANQVKFYIPNWMNEGLAEYLSDGWSTNSDMWMRDLAVNGGELPPIEWLTGYLAYRGGQSVWRFVTSKWGEESIAEIFYQIKKKNSVEKGVESALGVDFEELTDQWHKYLKKEYWPDVGTRQSIHDIARAVTDHEKLENSYNVAPALSPDGRTIAMISNKSGTFAIYLISAEDGLFLRRLIQGERNAEYEELHILKPGITWSPDGEYIAFAAKSGRADALFVVNVKTEDTRKYYLGMEGVFQPAWSPTRPEIAFIGNNGITSDIYILDLETEELTNLTDDWFTDEQVSWNPDGQSLLFVSDRGTFLEEPEAFSIRQIDISQTDIYSIRRDTGIITQITDTPHNETYPCMSSDSSTLAFISDEYGINNIYLKNDSLEVARPVTNLLAGVSQLSWSADNSYLVFSGFENSGYDVFLMSNPMELIHHEVALEPARWLQDDEQELLLKPDSVKKKSPPVSYDNYIFSSYYQNVIQDTSRAQVELSEEAVQDSTGEYRTYPYKTRFTLDLVQGYFSYGPTYSPEAMAYFLWSDMLGDHKIYLGTETQISLKNSDYFLMYRLLPWKFDYNFMFFHNADRIDGTFNLVTYDQIELWLRQTGLGVSASYPLSRFQRLDFGLEYSSVGLDSVYIDGYTLEEDEERLETLQTVVPSLNYVWDNTLWASTYPVAGSRYYLRYEFSDGVIASGMNFQTLSLDVRKYARLFEGVSFAGRFYAGASWGSDAQMFRVGGLPWLFSSEKDYYRETPSYSEADDYLQGIYYTKYVTPVRGAQINELNGHNALAVNLELRLPFLIYYFPTIRFLGQINGVLFTDFGMAWDERPDMWSGKSWDSAPQDFVWTYGLGPRFILLGMPWQLDYAWEINPDRKARRMWYLTIGLDF